MLAFALRREDWREYDQKITLYTLEAGRIEVLARGVKKILSKNSAFLESGNLIEAEIIPGKDINHLGSVRSIARFGQASHGLTITVGLSIFLTLVTHPERDERLFQLIYHWLNFVDQAITRDAVLQLDFFAVKLLSILGFDISFFTPISSNIQQTLMLVIRADWSALGNFKFTLQEAADIHIAIYNFCLYHAPSPINDWASLLI